jgi:hypothetical protein
MEGGIMAWPKPHNLTSLQEMFVYVDKTISGGLFSILLVIVMFMIIFVSSKLGGQTTAKSFILASFISFAITSLFWGAGIVEGKIMVILLIATIFSFVYLYVAQRT